MGSGALEGARRATGNAPDPGAPMAGGVFVIDAERFATTLASGIGRAKAFGCGLLLVRPLD